MLGLLRRLAHRALDHSPEDMLREIAACAAEHDDPRVHWLTVQVDRDLWDEIVRRYGAAREEP